MQPLRLPLSSIESNQEPYFAPTLIIPMLASFMRNINNVGSYSITSSNVRASPASEKMRLKREPLLVRPLIIPMLVSLVRNISNACSFDIAGTLNIENSSVCGAPASQQTYD